MKRFACVYVWLLCLVLSVAAQEKVVKLKIVQTSDVHGNFYPYNLFRFLIKVLPINLNTL